MVSKIIAKAPQLTEPSALGRRVVLEEIAETYLQTVVGVRSRFLADLALPPPEFINGELARKGEPWRIRSVAGSRWELHEI